MAKQFRARPSQLVGVDDPYIAYCFDDATYTWGIFVEGKLSEAENGVSKPDQRRAARERMWKQIFEADESKPTGMFRDPAAMFSKE